MKKEGASRFEPAKNANIFLRILFLVNRKPSERDTSPTNKFNDSTVSIM